MMPSGSQDMVVPDFDEAVTAALRLRDEGNALLNDGDFELALERYNEGLRLTLYDIEPHAMSAQARGRLVAVRTPLLMNSVLCELRMNPEEQLRRLSTAEQRVAEVLGYDPANLKALFRRAQLLGRAGEYAEAKELCEKLCRQDPSERAFRTELASINARSRIAKKETAAFWSTAVKKTLADEDLDGMEGGGRANSNAGESGRSQHVKHGLASRLPAALSPLIQWLLLWWNALLLAVRAGRSRLS